jgi:hypothetical protein
MKTSTEEKLFLHSRQAKVIILKATLKISVPINNLAIYLAFSPRRFSRKEINGNVSFHISSLFRPDTFSSFISHSTLHFIIYSKRNL